MTDAHWAHFFNNRDIIIKRWMRNRIVKTSMTIFIKVTLKNISVKRDRIKILQRIVEKMLCNMLKMDKPTFKNLIIEMLSLLTNKDLPFLKSFKFKSFFFKYNVLLWGGENFFYKARGNIHIFKNMMVLVFTGWNSYFSHDIIDSFLRKLKGKIMNAMGNKNGTNLIIFYFNFRVNLSAIRYDK